MCTICEEEFELFVPLAVRHRTWRLPVEMTMNELNAHHSIVKPHDVWLESPRSISHSEYRQGAAGFLRQLRKYEVEMRNTKLPLYLRRHYWSENLRLVFLAIQNGGADQEKMRPITRLMNKLIQENPDFLDDSLSRTYPTLARILLDFDIFVDPNSSSPGDAELEESKKLYHWLSESWMFRLTTEYDDRGSWEHHPGHRQRENKEIDNSMPFLWAGLKYLSMSGEVSVLKKICQVELLDLSGRNLMQIIRAATGLIHKQTPRKAFQEWLLTCSLRVQLFSALAFGTSVDREMLKEAQFYEREPDRVNSYFGAKIPVV